MKLSAPMLFLIVGVLICGCASRKQASSAPVPTASSLIITPDSSLAGKVVSYVDAGRFVVLNFPIGRMPAVGRTLFVYRNGLKTGEIRVSGPQQDNNIVADLVNGSAQADDEVRDQ